MSESKRHPTRWAWLVMLVATIEAGCSWQQDRLQVGREAFYAGELQHAHEVFSTIIEEGSSDADLARLDLAIACMAMGDMQNAERLLRSARDRFEYLEQPDALEAAQALLLDDRQYEYAGAYFERQLVASMLAATNLLHDGGDALAYTIQGEQLRQQLNPDSEPDADSEIPEVALGVYLHGVLREEMHSQESEALRSYSRVAAWQPEFSASQDDIRRMTGESHSKPGNGVVYLIAFVGRGPKRVEQQEIPTTIALAMAEQILSSSGYEALPIMVSPVKVAHFERQVCPIEAIQLAAGDHSTVETNELVSVGRIAMAEGAAKRNREVARAVARRAAKKGLAAAGRGLVDSSANPAAGLAVDLGAMAWAAAERADCRCWSLLPDSIHVARMELVAGLQHMSIRPLGTDGRLGEPQAIQVQVRERRNTYVFVNYPGWDSVGTVSVR